jgi:hypothetical protein
MSGFKELDLALRQRLWTKEQLELYLVFLKHRRDFFQLIVDEYEIRAQGFPGLPGTSSRLWWEYQRMYKNLTRFACIILGATYSTNLLLIGSDLEVQPHLIALCQ